MMINKRMKYLFVFLPSSVLFTIPALALTSCSEVSQKTTQFLDFSLNNDFSMSNRYILSKSLGLFKNLPTYDRDRIINEKLITTDFIFSNLELFVKRGTHDITPNKIVIHEVIKNTVNGVPAIDFAFYFRPNSIYIKDISNTNFVPVIKEVDDKYYVDPIRVHMVGQG